MREISKLERAYKLGSNDGFVKFFAGQDPQEQSQQQPSELQPAQSQELDASQASADTNAENVGTSPAFTFAETRNGREQIKIGVNPETGRLERREVTPSPGGPQTAANIQLDPQRTLSRQSLENVDPQSTGQQSTQQTQQTANTESSEPYRPAYETVEKARLNQIGEFEGSQIRIEGKRLQDKKPKGQQDSDGTSVPRQDLSSSAKLSSFDNSVPEITSQSQIIHQDNSLLSEILNDERITKARTRAQANGEELNFYHNEAEDGVGRTIGTGIAEFNPDRQSSESGLVVDDKGNVRTCMPAVIDLLH